MTPSAKNVEATNLFTGPALSRLHRQDFSIELTPAFWIGLVIRLFLVAAFIPALQSQLFLPFMRETLTHLSADPWSTFIALGGPVNAFPYGVAMYVAHAPTFAAGMGIDAAFGATGFSRLGFAASLLAADLSLFVILSRLFEDRKALVGWFYWLSPIVIYTTYYHGQTDIIPVAFLGGALISLRYHWAKAAGVFLALAVSAKLSMLLAVPFLALFAINNRQFRAKGLVFLGTALLATAILQLPVLLSPGAREMVLGSPEAARIFAFALPIGDGYSIYLFLIGYAAAVYGALAVGRINFDLLMALLGVGFLTILTLAPAAPGWFVWVAPFLVFYQLRENFRERAVLLVGGYSLLFVIEHLLLSSGASSPLLGLDFSAPLADRLGGDERLVSIIATLRTLAGVVIAISLYRRGVSSNDFFQLSRRPIAIGIAGDSGAGKDTLADALGGLFTPGAVIPVSGDDYHRFERGAPIWNVLTHLDPRANDLKAMTFDVQSLVSERAISQRHYDHGTGRFTEYRRRRGKDTVIVSGLHTLYSESLRDALDIKIFLDMDNGLRRALKIRRDVGERGHDRAKVEASIERRAADREKYIQPQRDWADIVFSLRPVSIDLPANEGDPSSGAMKLNVRWRDATDFADVARFLIGLCGARLDQRPPEMDGFVEFEVEGDIEADDIRLILSKIAPEADQILASEPRYAPGLLGVMQLVSIAHLIRQTRKRRMKD